MKTTRLGSFSDGFEDALCELREKLDHIGREISVLPSETSCANLGLGLQEHASELGRLFERLSSERSTVFLFGPPNSGKSTLLNALARRALVEVSPLPGYPAPVFVGYGVDDEITCRRFDGSKVSGLGHQAARVELRRAQAELARGVRELRQAGTDLSGLRQTGGVRRIDVAVPADELKQGRVRFVECPASAAPLFDSYADMLMGSHAGPSVAVFVVRAEDLFDERAFEGIDELLALYKNILVVVNIDRESRDLSDGGEVVKGLEVSDPVRLIEAFESLCAQPQLLQAIKEERVRLFPSDLLHAAVEAIHGPSSPESELPFEAEGDEQPASMKELERGLSERLDGSEELSTLVKSTLRRAREILGEILQLLESSELARAFSEHERVCNERERNLEIQATLQRILARGDREWELEPCFASLRETLLHQAQHAAEALQGELRPIFATLLEDWFQSDDSLEELTLRSLASRLAEARSEIHRNVALALRSEWHPTRGGFGSSVVAEFDRTGIDPSGHQEAVQDGLTAFEDSQPLRPLDVEAIQPRPGFFDHVFFRSGARLRRKVLGPASAPSRALSAKEKAKRFDDAARQEMRANAEQRIDVYLTDLCRRLTSDATSRQVALFAGSIRDEARSRLEDLDAPLRQLEQRIEALEELRHLTENLATVRGASVNHLEELAARHARTDLDLLVPHVSATPVRAVVPDGVALEPSRERGGV